MSCSDYANGLVSDAKNRYLDKLKLLNIECPYSISNSMWKHALDCYPFVPKISLPDIFIYLVETKSYQNYLEALGAYKGISSESQQAVRDGWVIEFMAIALATQVVLMKAKVSPSQTLSESPHKPMDYYYLCDWKSHINESICIVGTRHS
ncbi:Uncharacterized protein APZ42_019146 [Daphnia magna]|uniref:Uncharacterized protein n=1 Tax=Daphnia magna TaxID=35525 RepID=A0A164YJE0_9CRUS|nr:Uncharacterized protein APZ42_019146 [Daphnia magna]